MKRERAADILRWGPYAKPPPTDHDKREALSMLAQDPTLRDALHWPTRHDNERKTNARYQ